MASATQPPDPSVRLAQLQRQIEQLQRLGGLGAYEWDLQADRLYWSDELHHILGVRPSRAPKTLQDYLQLVHPDDQARVEQTMRSAATTGEAYAFDHRVVRPDKSLRWLRCRGTVVFDDGGEPAWLYGIKDDITERKGVEAALQHFVADAAHELRTPTAAIWHASELLSSARLGARPRQEVVEALHRQVRRLREVTGKLLDLTALEQGIETLLLRRVAVAPAVHEALAAVDSLAGHRVRVDVPPDIEVQAEPGHLVELLVQLLDNAGRYGGPNVSVTCSVEEHEVLLYLEDDGPGVPPSQVPVLFLPFRRELARRGGGAGHGLSVAHRIVTTFGGALHYQRRQPRGSRFVVRLESPWPLELV